MLCDQVREPERFKKTQLLGAGLGDCQMRISTGAIGEKVQAAGFERFIDPVNSIVDTCLV
jgi:hypothetical protein